MRSLSQVLALSMCESEYAAEVHYLATLALPDYIPAAWRNRVKIFVDDRGVHYLWTGWNNGEGHGKVRVAGKMRYTHREIVERVTGRKLSRWDYVDHKCELKPCLNFDCLDPTTPGENTARGPGRHTQYRKHLGEPH